MKVSILGLGPVGMTNAAFLSDKHQIIGCDIATSKINRYRRGDYSEIEEEVANQLLKNKKNIEWSENVENSIKNSSCTIICIGTPLDSNNEIDYSGVLDVTKVVVECVAGSGRQHIVIYRSTLPPGSFSRYVLPLFKKNLEGDLGKRVFLGLMPEFLREGSLYRDFLNPGLLLIGRYDENSGKEISHLFEDIKCEVTFSSIEVAEMVKQVCNAFHALKISFSNEISQVCRSLHVNGRDVMEIMCKDEKLNISKSYLSPGVPFGGSCLEKDVRSLINYSAEFNINTNLINAINNSNENLIQRIFDEVVKYDIETIGMLGISFKYGTHDYRKSVGIKLADKLIDRNKNIVAIDFDQALNGGVSHHDNMSERVISSNQFMIVESIEDIVSQTNVIIVTQNNEKYLNIISKVSDCIILDLTAQYPEKIKDINNIITFV